MIVRNHPYDPKCKCTRCKAVKKMVRPCKPRTDTHVTHQIAVEWVKKMIE